MASVIDRRPFGKLGDQQLLDQTKRLAVNQWRLDLRMLDHLDEIDRRGLALRRGFSSLFEYAVRELQFTDAAAQRRIQTMRLRRRHGWVRPLLESGEMSLTSAAQFETAFAGAERQWRKLSELDRLPGHDEGGDDPACAAECRRRPEPRGEAGERAERGRTAGSEPASGHATAVAGRVVGATAPAAPAATGAVPVDQAALSRRDAEGRASFRGNGRDHDNGLAGAGAGDWRRAAEPGVLGAGTAPAGAPGLARHEVGAASSADAPSAPGRAWRSEELSLAAVDSLTPEVVAVSAAVAPGRVPQHSGVRAPCSELNGNAESALPVRSCRDASAARTSDDCSAPDLPSLTGRSAQAAHAALPTEAPPQSLRYGSRPSEPSAGVLSVSPLLNPQRQRELIEQAAGLSTRQVAGLLAAAAPLAAPSRDTLRAVGHARYSLKASVDKECERGLRLLKDLLSHVDPHMSWGDLVGRLVREAVARHDPRAGGRRRQGAGTGSDAALRAPRQTRAAGQRELSGAASELPGRGSRQTRVAVRRERAVGEDEAAGRGAKQARSAVRRERAVGEDEAAGRGAKQAGLVERGSAVGESEPAEQQTGAANGSVVEGGRGGTPAPQYQAVAVARPSLPSMVPSSSLSHRLAVAAPPGHPHRDGQQRRATGVGGKSPTQPSSPAAGAGGESGPRAAPDVAAAPECTAGNAPGEVGAAAMRARRGRGGTPAPRVATAEAGTRSRGSMASYNPPLSRLAYADRPNGVRAGSDAMMTSDRASPTQAADIATAAGVAGSSSEGCGDGGRGLRRSSVRRAIPAAVRRYVWQRDEGRCRYRDPLTGRRCSSSHLLQIDHVLPVAEGGGPVPENCRLLCAAHHRLRHGDGPAAAPEWTI